MLLTSPFALVSALAVAGTSSALVIRNSPITLPLVRRFQLPENTTLAAVDRARANVLVNRDPRTTRSPVNIISDGTTYLAEVNIGTPPTTYNLLIDTGSSNTWVGATKPYTPTVSSVNLHEAVSVTYGSGSFSGVEWSDTLTLGENLVIYGQSIGVALTSSGFNGLDGILGIGPTDLTSGTTSNDELVPTVTDNAWDQRLLAFYEVGIGFKPVNDPPYFAGELTFGNVDTSLLTGPLNTIPLTSTYPASSYVGIDQSVTYGAARIPILSQTAGITDTGTTLILLASDAYTLYQEATGAVYDPTVELLRISPAQYDALESLFFTIGGETYEFTKNAQIWPRSLNAEFGGDPDAIYLIVSNLGTPSGQGLDFINGYTFLQRFYTVYSTGGRSFSIAETTGTFSVSN